MSILHIESFENRGDEGLLAKTDAGASTVFLVVDFDVEELACRPEIRNLVFFRKPGLDFDRCFGSVCWVQHRDVVDVQKHQNTIAVEIEVGVGQGLCELESEQQCVNIVVPKWWCLFEAVKCFLELNNDCRCLEALRPAFGQRHTAIVIIDLRIEKSSDDIQTINVPARLCDQGDKILKSGEFSDRGISFSDVHLFVALNHSACLVSYGGVGLLFHLVDQFGANRH